MSDDLEYPLRTVTDGDRILEMSPCCDRPMRIMGYGDVPNSGETWVEYACPCGQRWLGDMGDTVVKEER